MLFRSVAEALGWTDLRPESPRSDVLWLGTPPPGYIGRPSQSHYVDGVTTYAYAPPHFDVLWGETGPLIEKYNLSIEAHWSGPKWRAYAGVQPRETRGAFGKTPLQAVCILMLELKAVGKL